MPRYTEVEQRNIDTVNSMFDGSFGTAEAIFSDDAVWWNGLPKMPGLEGETEHKGIETIKSILYGAGEDKSGKGVDSYDLSTNSFTDIVILADNDYVVRQHTQHSKTLGGKNYKNVYCFVFRFNDDGKIQYLTEHWNTWYANKVLMENWDIEAAHPTG
ncbi:MAG: nuclear transport factor 2 family protein [Pseudomonadales bacterium]